MPSLFLPIRMGMTFRFTKVAGTAMCTLALILSAGTASAVAVSTMTASITGPITVLGSSWFTLQTAGRSSA